MKCPFHKLRPGLPPLTARLAALPIDERGYPIPFFVGYPNGKPDFRCMDRHKLMRCVKEKLCWCCGQRLGAHLAFAIGPMCAINRTSAEPPSHLDCAQWSIKGCPFLSRPNMVRREDEETAKLTMAGMAIFRNPGVMCLWQTKCYKNFPDQNGGILFEIGEPETISWWREGRPATLAEVSESIATGLPALYEACEGKKDDLDELEKCIKRVGKFLPA